MGRDDWPHYCRTLLSASVVSAAAQFPGRGEMERSRVHNVRKTLKEARALARLFQKCVGEPARVTIAALAVVRRQVGNARDLDVIEARLGRLAPPQEITGPLGAVIARARESASRGHTQLAARATRARLNAIARRIEELGLGRVADSDIVAAVARTYRQGRQRGRIAFACDDPAALHALRSRVVDLRYQLAALSPAWPAALNAQSDALNALRDTLGDFNDLSVLAQFASERGGLPAEALAVLGTQVKEKQEKLRRRAKIEFDRLFAETPTAFAHRLAAYLDRPMKELRPKEPKSRKGETASGEGRDEEPPARS
jgi:CHAD domain-containing protein